MTQRNPIVIIVLMLVSCGLYAFYYTYETTKELLAFLGRDDVDPTTELIINLLTCGLFGMYVEYRNQQMIDAWYQSQGLQHEAKAQLVGLCNLGTFFIGATWLVATYVHVEELNELGTSSASPTTI
ncbi:MAG: DUF4234 domain-containing protein [Myxococcales bacterium]|nr:DUF4234 domain-containing protein [Myxococcales bacterium]